MMNKNWLSPAAVCALASGVVACSGSGSPSGQCASNTDCPANEVCSNGVCASAQAGFAFAPASLSLTATVGEAPATASVVLSTSSASSITYSISCTLGLTSSPAVGDLSASASASLTIQAPAQGEVGTTSALCVASSPQDASYTAQLSVVIVTSAASSGGGAGGGAGGGSGGGSGGGTGGGAGGGTGGSAGGSAGGSGGGSAGGSAGGSGGGSGQSAAQACSALASASCDLRNSCSNGYAIDKNYGSVSTCEARATATCEAELSLTGTGQTPANIETCVAAYPGYSCTDFYDGNPPPDCATPVGTQALGAACAASAQCASSFCALSASTVCGTCQARPVAGMTCQVQADCGKDLACAMAANATSGTCAAYVASGGACLTSTSPCEAGLSCVGEKASTNTQGVCQPAVTQIGAACDGNHKTAPDCDANQGLTCIPTTSTSAVGTCQAIQLVAAGATCGKIGSPAVTMVADCEAGGQCIKAATGDKTGTCAAAAADGAACDSSNTVGPPCLAPAKCIPTSSSGTAGVCTLPDPASCH